MGFSAVGRTPITPPHHHRAPKNKDEKKKGKSAQEVSKVTTFLLVELRVQIRFLSQAHRATGRQCLDETLKHKLACHAIDPFRSFIIVLYVLIVMLRDISVRHQIVHVHDLTLATSFHTSCLPQGVDTHVHVIGILTQNCWLLLILGLIYNRCNLLHHNF